MARLVTRICRIGADAAIRSLCLGFLLRSLRGATAQRRDGYAAEEFESSPWFRPGKNVTPVEVREPHEGTLRSVFLIGLTLGFIYLCWKLVAPFLAAFVWALALAIACAPLRIRLVAHLQKFWVSVLLVAFVAIVIAVPLTFVLRQLFQELLKPQSNLRDSFDTHVSPILAWADRQFDLTQLAQQAAAAAAGWIAPVLAHSAGAISQTGVTLLALFFFLRDQDEILATLRRLVPLSPEETDMLMVRIGSAVRSTVHGRLFVGLLQGTLGGIAFALLGLPAPVLWALIMSILSIMPMLGAFIVWVPMSILLVVGGHWIRAVILVAWGVLVIHPVDNLLYPVLVGARLGLHPLVLFIAFVGGVLVFGPAGLILGPCIIAGAAGLLELWEARQCRLA